MPGLGFLQRNILNTVQAGETLTVADVSAIAGPEIDHRHIRRAFKSLYRRGLVTMTVRPVIAVRAASPASRIAPFPPGAIRSQKGLASKASAPAVQATRRRPASAITLVPPKPSRAPLPAAHTAPAMKPGGNRQSFNHADDAKRHDKARRELGKEVPRQAQTAPPPSAIDLSQSMPLSAADAYAARIAREGG
jgi:hypothetical protein